MKKNILKLTLVAAIALTAGFMVSQENKELALSDVMLNNVEALANKEDMYAKIYYTGDSGACMPCQDDLYCPCS